MGSDATSALENTFDVSSMVLPKLVPYRAQLGCGKTEMSWINANCLPDHADRLPPEHHAANANFRIQPLPCETNAQMQGEPSQDPPMI